MTADLIETKTKTSGLKNTLKVLTFLSIGILLFFLIYYDQLGFVLTDSSFKQMRDAGLDTHIISKIIIIKDKTYFGEEAFTDDLRQHLGTGYHENVKNQIYTCAEQRFERLKSALANANYIWLFMAMLIGMYSHYLRAIRWNLLIEPLGYKPRKKNLFLSVLVMYVTNMAIPRSGEVARCAVITRYEKVPFANLLGTVFIERLADMVVLLLFAVIVVITQLGVVAGFIEQNPDVASKIEQLKSSMPYIITIMVVGLAAFVWFIVNRKKFARFVVYRKIETIVEQFIAGLQSIRSLQKRKLFIAHSLFIWLLYFTTIFMCFQAFEFTSNLGVLAGLTVFVMASFGMVAPSPGGMGTWHFMTYQTLFIYGIGLDDGKVFALAVHSAQTIVLVFFGLVAIVALPLINRKM